VTWERLLAENKIKLHEPSRRGIEDLFALVKRDLKDSAVPGLSNDRSFAISYNAVQQLSQAIVACCGYRVRNIPGHHRVMFECMELALGHNGATYAAYFDQCRIKRNHLKYDHSSVVSETEALELLKSAQEFFEDVRQLIAERYPALLPIS